MATTLNANSLSEFDYHLLSLRYWIRNLNQPNGGYVSAPREIAWHQSQAIGWASR